MKFEYPKRTPRALQGYSKATPRAPLGHLGTQALKTLEHLGNQAFESNSGHLGTQALRHLGARRVLEHSGAQTFGPLGTRGTRGTLFSKLFILGFNVSHFSKASGQAFFSHLYIRYKISKMLILYILNALISLKRGLEYANWSLKLSNLIKRHCWR